MNNDHKTTFSHWEQELTTCLEGKNNIPYKELGNTTGIKSLIYYYILLPLNDDTNVEFQDLVKLIKQITQISPITSKKSWAKCKNIEKNKNKIDEYSPY